MDVSLQRFWAIYKGHQNGELWSRVVKFNPKNSENFKKWSIDYDINKNHDINRGIVLWPPIEEGFFCILGPDFPCSVIHRPNKGNDGSQAHVNFWYNPDKGFYLQDSSYTYRLAPFVKANRARNEPPTMYLYKFIIPVSYTEQLRWHDVFNRVKVKVTDMFGNSGEFNLSIDKENFDIPAVS